MLIRVKHTLPATITEARGFGSVLRGKPNPHDLDILFLYTMTKSQKTDWEWFASTFGLYERTESRDERARVAGDLLRRTLRKYYEEDTLQEALDRPEVKEVAGTIQLNLLWAKCFTSWNEYLYGHRRDGRFTPDVPRVLMNRVAKRFATQGLQIHFVNSESIDPSSNWIPSISVVRNFRKIWDPNISLDEIPNRFQMNLDELRTHLRAELGYFTAEHARAVYELRKDVDRILKDAEKAKLDLSTIMSSSELVVSDDAPIARLQDQCEEAREQLRSDMYLKTFLGFLGCALPESGPDLSSLTERILQTTPAKYMVEGILRDFMHRLGLPEEEFVVLRAHDFKEVIHEISEQTRKELLNQNTQMDIARKLRRRVNAVLPFKRKLVYTQILPTYSGDIPLTDGKSIPKFGEIFRLRIVYSCPEAEFRELQQSLIDNRWEMREPQIAKYNDIEKMIEFHFDETLAVAKDRLADAILPFCLIR
jgi:hypothetical protein